MVNGGLATTIGALEDASTDSLHGKIGTTTEMSNISLYDTALPLVGAKKTTSAMATADIFTVSGGVVRLNNIQGWITTACGAGANNTKLVFKATAGGNTDLCALLDVASSAQYKWFSITGTFVNAMVLYDTAGGVLPGAQAGAIFLTPGTIEMNCAASTAGVVDWYMDYTPMVVGAKIAAA